MGLKIVIEELQTIVNNYELSLAKQGFEMNSESSNMRPRVQRQESSGSADDSEQPSDEDQIQELQHTVSQLQLESFKIKDSLTRARKDKEKALKLLICIVGKERMGRILLNHAGNADILDTLVETFGPAHQGAGLNPESPGKK